MSLDPRYKSRSKIVALFESRDELERVLQKYDDEIILPASVRCIAQRNDQLLSKNGTEDSMNINDEDDDGIFSTKNSNGSDLEAARSELSQYRDEKYNGSKTSSTADSMEALQ